MLFGIDLEEPDVVEEIPAHDARADPVAVPELDVDLLGRLDREPVSPSPAVVITWEFVRM